MKHLEQSLLKIKTLEELKATELKTCTESLQSNLLTLENYDIALDLITATMRKVLLRRKFIEETMTYGFQIIYDAPYKFFFEVIEQDGMVKGCKPRIQLGNGPARDFKRKGKGITEVGTILFDIIILALNKNTAGFLMIDEPAARISGKMQERLRDVLEYLSKQLNIQLLVTTHYHLPFGRVYKVTLNRTDTTAHSTIKEIEIQDE